jgi:hypothetical protein
MKKLLALGLAISFCAPMALADTAYDKFDQAASKAYHEKNFNEAEKDWLLAVKEAESSKEWTPKLPDSLDKLGMLYKLQDNYTAAEEMYRR